MNFSNLWQYLPDFIGGLGVSVVVTLVGMTVGSVAGLGVYAVARSSRRLVALVGQSYIELIRNTPLLVQLYLLYFGLPSIGVDLSALWATLVGLSANTAAYMAEVFRAGFASTPTGQREAAAVLGMTRAQAFRYVLLKPAIKRVMPAMDNQLVLLFLFSSIAALLSLNELMNVTLNVGLATALRVETLILGGVLYYATAALFSWSMRFIDRRVLAW